MNTYFDKKIKNFYEDLFSELLADTKEYLKNCCFNEETTDSEIKTEIVDFINGNFDEIQINVHKQDNSFLVFITLNNQWEIFSIDRETLY